MRVLFVVDGRSPTALNWISYFLDGEHEVHLVSTFACTPDERWASFHLAPVAFSQFKAAPKPTGDKIDPGLRRALQTAPGKTGTKLPAILQTRGRTLVRQWLGPLTLPGAARRLRRIIAEVQPDLVHAMRIPYEGMLAALADPSMPVLVSVWGNDFTLHARATSWVAAYTRRTLRRVDALHADCQRDVRLARQWGLPVERPAIVLPGGGGIQLEQFYPPEHNSVQQPVVINPRGIRAYVRNDTFFAAIPLVLQQRPDTRFICPSMAGEAQAERWLSESGCAAQVRLLPRLPRSHMADYFRQAQVVVSPSTHDGTPNTVLEALACGCFPVVGDIESLREWIVPGQNGFLIDPADPQALAQAILTALGDEPLRQRAKAENLRQVAERAEYLACMQQAERFYSSLIR
jgi:glycosyltransferase involved in cell wall biosynthesis